MLCYIFCGLIRDDGWSKDLWVTKSAIQGTMFEWPQLCFCLPNRRFPWWSLSWLSWQMLLLYYKLYLRNWKIIYLYEVKLMNLSPFLSTLVIVFFICVFFSLRKNNLVTHFLIVMGDFNHYKGRKTLINQVGVVCMRFNFRES